MPRSLENERDALANDLAAMKVELARSGAAGDGRPSPSHSASKAHNCPDDQEQIIAEFFDAEGPARHDRNAAVARRHRRLVEVKQEGGGTGGQNATLMVVTL